MKISKQQAIKLLNQLNVQVADITENEDLEGFSSESIVKNYLDEIKPVIYSEYERDLLPAKLKENAGVIGGKLKNYIKKASGGLLKESDLSGKTDEEAILLLSDIISNNKSQDVDTIKAQMRDLMNEHQSQLEQINNDWESKVLASESKVKDFYIKNNLEDIIKKMPLPQGDNSKRANLLKMAISENYKINWNPEKNNIEIFDKETGSVPVLDGNRFLDVNTFAQSYFKDLGLIQTDTRAVDLNKDNNPKPTQQVGSDLERVLRMIDEA